jgi:hypothetical protein
MHWTDDTCQCHLGEILGEREEHMRALLSVLMIGGAILGSPGIANSEASDAEAMVAQLLWGLDPNSRLTGSHTWVVDGPASVQGRYSVTHRSACLFSASLERLVGTGRLVRIEYLLDFAAVHDFMAWYANPANTTIITKIEGRDWYTQRIVDKTAGHVLDCVRGNVQVFVAKGGSLDRVRAAFRELRTTFCPERPAKAA